MAVLKHSGLETDFRMATRLDEALNVSLHDMADIRSMPGAVLNLGTVNQSGSDTHQIRFADLGQDPMVADATEDAQTAGTGVTTSTNTPSIAVVRQVLGREISDLGIITGFSSDLNPQTLAADMKMGYTLRFMDLVATAIATAGTDVGTSTVNMSVDDFYDATFQLEITDNNGPFYSLLHGRQTADFRESLRGEGGALQFREPAGRFLDLKGQGLQGDFLGVNVFKSSRVTSAGGNRHGAMWSAGALGYKTGQLGAENFLGTASIVVQIGEVTVEIAHTVGGGKVQVFGDAYLGLSLLEDARIVGIVTDA